MDEHAIVRNRKYLESYDAVTSIFLTESSKNHLPVNPLHYRPAPFPASSTSNPVAILKKEAFSRCKSTGETGKSPFLWAEEPPLSMTVIKAELGRLK